MRESRRSFAWNLLGIVTTRFLVYVDHYPQRREVSCHLEMIAAQSPPELVEKLFNHAGALEGYRTYKNNVCFVVADEDQGSRMIEVAQRYLAIGRIVGDSDRMSEFNDEQRNSMSTLPSPRPTGFSFIPVPMNQEPPAASLGRCFPLRIKERLKRTRVLSSSVP